MKGTNFEIEVRGTIPKRKFGELKNFLDRNASFRGRHKRLLIDYSSVKEGLDRKLDVRCRITDDQPEIIVKEGNITQFARTETSVKLDKKDFPNAVRLFAAIGYDKGIATTRFLSKYIYNEMEFTLVEITKLDQDLKEHGICDYSYEIEMMPGKGNVKTAKVKLDKMLNTLDLPVFIEYIPALPTGSKVKRCELRFNDYLKLIHKKATILLDANKNSAIYSYKMK